MLSVLLRDATAVKTRRAAGACWPIIAFALGGFLSQPVVKPEDVRRSDKFAARLKRTAESTAAKR